MRIQLAICVGVAALITGALPAVASPKIFAVHTAENYCPEGLQPVSMDGTICCGVPNQDISYQAAMTHGASKKRHKPRASSTNCPIGTKGCN